MKPIKLQFSWSMLTACVLIFIASADDFELLRFLLPGLPYSARITLDDKNGDFLQAESVRPVKSQVCAPGWIGCAGVVALAAIFQWDFCLCQIAGHSREFSPAHVPDFLPLRC